MRIQSLEYERHIGQYVRKAYFYREVANLGLNPNRILDVGCGYGSYLVGIAEIFPTAELVGVDYNASGIDHAQSTAQENNNKNMEFFVHDARKPFGVGEFDFIYSIDVLEHIEEDSAVFKNIYNTLKPGGLFIIHVPLSNRNFPLKKMFDFDDYEEPPDHVRDGYNENELLEKIKAAGFRILKRTYTFGPFGTVAWEVMRVFESKSQLSRFFGHQLSKVLCALELGREKKRGNGILLVAERTPG